ncbi:MAG: hypothetical protein IT438_05830 [Phycisphaerales bacterium]|nr:hypothetical protein [Phycisphaerales bacterium]
MNSMAASLFVGAALLATAPSHAQITLNIVPAQSSLTAGGTAAGLGLSAQGPGADVTSYTGTIVISDPVAGGGAFSFISANAIAGISGNWAPNINGAAGTAPANYGLRQTLLGATAALRDGRFGLTSGSLTLSGGASGGTYPASQVTGTALQGNNDYNAGVLGVGRSSIAGLTAPAASSGNGNITISGSNITLTLPVSMSFAQTVNGVNIVVTLNGQLVATGTLPAQTGACCQGSTCVVTTAAACPSQTSQRFAGVGTACNAAGNNTSPCCKADFNQSGAPVTVQDIFDFLSAYFSNSALADINGAGGVSVQDIFDFLSAYFAGC